MNSFIIPDDLEIRIASAAASFWKTRNGQAARQSQSGVKDRGNRAAATGGKQLDGFVELVKDILILNQVPQEDIFTDSDLELPGYYRPNKKWDLLVVHNSTLIAAIEFKSQIGPSFGNNFNNRTEEAMGSALDIWTAYREGVFGTQPSPWLGYFMVLEDCKASNTAVKLRSPHFPVLDEFVDSSYMKRYEIFCSKLLLERQYSASCFAAISESDAAVNCCFPKEELSCRRFICSMLGAVSTFYGWESRQ